MHRQLYSEELIKKNPRCCSLDINLIRSLLYDRTRNLEDRDYEMDYKDLILVTALDHYMCKKMVNGEPVINNSMLDVYLKNLGWELKIQPLLFYSLPIFRLDYDILNKYIPGFKDIIDSCGNKLEEALIINEKIKCGDNITSSELSTLLKTFNYFMSYDMFEAELGSEFELVVQYLLTKADNLGYDASSFLIKYFGYKKCCLEKLSNVQILIGDCDGCEGISAASTITLSKKKIKQTNYSKNDMKNEFSNEGLVILSTLFHELRHAFQVREADLCKVNDISFRYATRSILSQLDSDEYHRNYNFYDIEADANYAGWKEVVMIIKKYFPGSSLKEETSRIYAQKHFYKQHINYKKDKYNQKLVTGLFVKEQLDNYFSRNPKTLSGEYSQFSRFYYSNGAPKNLEDLLTLKDVDKYENFYYDQIVARAYQGYKIRKDMITLMSLEEKKNLISNCVRIVKLSSSKLDYIYKNIELNEKIKNNGLESRNILSIDVFNINVDIFYKMAKKYVGYINNIFKLYPELYDDNIIFRVNGYINSINNNPVVKRKYLDSSIDNISNYSMNGGRKYAV